MKHLIGSNGELQCLNAGEREVRITPEQGKRFHVHVLRDFEMDSHRISRHQRCLYPLSTGSPSLACQR